MEDESKEPAQKLPEPDGSIHEPGSIPSSVSPVSGAVSNSAETEIGSAAGQPDPGWHSDHGIGSGHGVPPQTGGLILSPRDRRGSGRADRAAGRRPGRG